LGRTENDRNQRAAARLRNRDDDCPAIRNRVIRDAMAYMFGTRLLPSRSSAGA
jgi:hypothetical protein